MTAETFSQAAIDYERIEKAIAYLIDNFHAQPGLKEIAAKIHVSEYHFQRLFSRWVGISPKRFLQFLTKEHAKKLLDDGLIGEIREMFPDALIGAGSVLSRDDVDRCIAAGAAWWWARRKGLVREGITSEEKLGVQIEAFAEPLTALVTLPFAYVGELAWNLAWLAYIPIAAFLRRRGVDHERSP